MNRNYTHATLRISIALCGYPFVQILTQFPALSVLRSWSWRTHRADCSRTYDKECWQKVVSTLMYRYYCVLPFLLRLAESNSPVWMWSVFAVLSLLFIHVFIIYRLFANNRIFINIFVLFISLICTDMYLACRCRKSVHTTMVGSLLIQVIFLWVISYCPL